MIMEFWFVSLNSAYEINKQYELSKANFENHIAKSGRDAFIIAQHVLLEAKLDENVYVLKAETSRDEVFDALKEAVEGTHGSILLISIVEKIKISRLIERK